jgi:hypothetical protein
MKTLILASALIAVSGFGGIAAAQNTADVSSTTRPTTTSTADVALGTKQVPAVDSRDCIRDTGSHIKRRDQACLPVNGNSYSQEDLQRTGNPDVGRALQQLDPRIQVSHGH